MSRAKRVTLGGYVYHVLNRANGRLRIFRKHDDFLAFEQVMAEAIELFNMRVCGYCIMSNHWHFLLWPRSDGTVLLPHNWNKLVNAVVKNDSYEELKNCIKRGTPYGDKQWKINSAKKMKLESTLRPRGRPKKST
jgi:REP element-mobilizing transposase RayT